MSDVGTQHQFSAPYRIDVHYHIFPPRFMSNQEKLNPKWGPQAPPSMVEGWTPQSACDDLDRYGIATAIAQMKAAPGVWFGNVRAACELAREWNEYAARMTRDFPGRFGMLAVVPMPDIDGTLREIEYAYDVLNTDGVQLMSHYDGKYPGDPKFRAVMEELNRRKAVVLVHPFLPPMHDILPGVRPATIEFPFDSTRAIVSLVLSGTTSEFPNIRFIFCHGGGVVPYLAGRIEELTREIKGRWMGEAPPERDRDEVIPKGIEFELKKLYYEIANAYHRPTFAGLQALAPQPHILFGTDYPFVTIPAHIEGLQKVAPSESVRRAIERDNALALFPKFAKTTV
jgi:predicted TIM-barrel fold metal-dependent hydrolase